MAKKSNGPKQQSQQPLNIVGLNKLLASQAGAAAKVGATVQAALNKAGLTHLRVVIPGAKNPTGPAPRFNKRTPSKGRKSSE